MAYFKARFIHYQRIFIIVTIVLKSNEDTEKNNIFGSAMPGHHDSLKLRPEHLEQKLRLPLHTFIMYMNT
jgi:hypothetical protein